MATHKEVIKRIDATSGGSNWPPFSKRTYEVATKLFVLLKSWDGNAHYSSGMLNRREMLCLDLTAKLNQLRAQSSRHM